MPTRNPVPPVVSRRGPNKSSGATGERQGTIHAERAVQRITGRSASRQSRSRHQAWVRRDEPSAEGAGRGRTEAVVGDDRRRGRSTVAARSKFAGA